MKIYTSFDWEPDKINSMIEKAEKKAGEELANKIKQEILKSLNEISEIFNKNDFEFTHDNFSIENLQEDLVRNHNSNVTIKLLYNDEYDDFILDSEIIG